MKPPTACYPAIGTTVFTVMSALAASTARSTSARVSPTRGPAVSAGGGRSLKDGHNQYPPMMGLPALRQAVAVADRRFYGLDVDWATRCS